MNSVHSRLLCPQVLWKSYIDFEIEQEEFENTRNLYKRLLQRTQHVKVRAALHKPDPRSNERSNKLSIVKIFHVFRVTCQPSSSVLTVFFSCRFGSATPSSSCRWTAPTDCRSAGRSMRRPIGAWGTARRRRRGWCCSSPGETSRRSSAQTALESGWGSCCRRRWRRGGSWLLRMG